MLTRGDSAYITVTLKAQDGAAYTMQAGDKLTLTVRKQAVDTSSVLLQSVSDSNTIKLAPEQTVERAFGVEDAAAALAAVREIPGKTWIDFSSWT